MQWKNLTELIGINNAKFFKKMIILGHTMFMEVIWGTNMWSPNLLKKLNLQKNIKN